jgi:8-oxo-dGTP pyrophosphatase MutT (NUDIX family)
VLDAEGRVLLLRWIDARDGLSVWMTPGGGILDGEAAADAARRELLEETGIAAESVGPLVMHQLVRSADLVRDEDHFVVQFAGGRGPASAPDPGTDGWRWWHLSEIDGSRECFHPHNVGRLLRHVLHGRPDHIEDEHTIS